MGDRPVHPEFAMVIISSNLNDDIAIMGFGLPGSKDRKSPDHRVDLPGRASQRIRKEFRDGRA